MLARNTLATFMLVATPALAQAPGAPSAAAPARPTIPPAEQQIAAAILPIPAEFRGTAQVLGYSADAKLVVLRPGTGAYVCLASDPRVPRFHVACYHRSLEPFMARGRELRAQGLKAEQVDSARFSEIRSGKLAMPAGATALYSLTGGSFDPATGTTAGARPLFVVYIPNATAESTGLTEKPVQGAPWIMYPGTPKAHIMFVPTM